MSNEFSTTLYTALKKAAREVIHEIAKEGVVALKKALDRAGFTKSEYLKNYEVYSHVIGDAITFEILVDLDSVEAGDEMTRQALEDQEDAIKAVEATYGVRSGRAYTRVRDARKPAGDARQPAKDARKPARDARTNAQDRLLGHEIALHAPRSARITRQGKLAVTLKRSMRETEKASIMPQGKFDGIMKDVMDDLNSVIFENFIPELQEIIDNYVG